MMELTAKWPTQGVVLCLGAHCDDIGIGCGATLSRLAGQNPGLRFHWVVFSGDARRAEEERAAAAAFLGAAARDATVEIHAFRDGFFPYQGAEVKVFMEGLKQRVAPALVLTHHVGDRHQDHRLLGELAWNTFRNHWIVEYEVPKYDGDLGTPNLFVAHDREAARRKAELLMRCYPSQASRRWFDPETFTSLMRVRGIECASPGGYAEAFHCRKAVLG